MSRSVSLTNLITRVRQRADIESDLLRFTDAEITTNLNESIAELYDIILSAYGQDYFRSTYAITLVAGQSVYSLPVSFLSLISVDIFFGTTTNWVQTVAPYMENERNWYKFAAGLTMASPSYYRLQGANIAFIPVPNGTYTASINYIPTSPLLVVGSDTFDGINGWEEFAVLDAAIKCLLKDEEFATITVLEQRKSAIAQRIRDRATERDAGQPDRVHDVTSGNRYGYGSGWE